MMVDMAGPKHDQIMQPPSSVGGTWVAREQSGGLGPRQVELPLGATEDRICGTIDIERALGEGVKAYEPGLLVNPSAPGAPFRPLPLTLNPVMMPEGPAILKRIQ